MGYYTNTNLVFGVKLNPTDAKKLYEFHGGDNGFSLFTDEEIEELDEGVDYETEMWSEETDSRIHNLSYQPGHTSYVGILLTDEKEEITKLVKSPPKNINDIFNKYFKPKLKNLNLSTEPDFHIFTQTV
jgi:hypothetical protein